MVTVTFSRHYPFVIREQLKSVLADAGKLRWGREPVFQPKDVDTYYTYFDTNGTIQRSIIDLSETAGGQGFYLTVDTDEKAKELCDEFNQRMNLDGLIPNIMRNMLIAGFMPVETNLHRLPSKCSLKMIYPPSVAKIIPDPKTAELLRIEQKSNRMGVANIQIEANHLAWFTYNQVGNKLTGTSIIKGIVDLLGYQDNAITSMDKIIARYASPLGIWKSRRSIETIKQLVESVEAGQDIFLGHLTEDEIKNVVEHIQIDPRARFWEFYEYLDRKVYESLGAPSLGYWRNATQASAEVLDDIVQRNVHALQRNVKRVIEASWYAPLCQLNNCTEVPKLEWGLERTGIEDVDISDFLVKGVELGLISLNQYMQLLQSMGLRIEPEAPEKPVSGAAQPPTEEALIPRYTSIELDPDAAAKLPCSESPDEQHDWVLARLKARESTWVCKYCGATRVKQIPYVIQEAITHD